MQKLGNPVPFFLDAGGLPMDGGHIYVGTANGDPEIAPIALFWDVALSVPATQPLRTIGGLIVNGTTPAAVFIAQDDYAMRVTDARDTLVFYSPSVFTDTSSFQPLDADLTAISGQGNTAFGLGLLTIPNQAGLVAATGIPAPLPAAGGPVSGNITRAGGGVHTYWLDPAMTGGRIFITAEGAADPTSQPGDIWFTY